MKMMAILGTVAMVFTLLDSPVIAQTQTAGADEQDQELRTQPAPGRTADSAAGTVGQRRTRERVSEDLGVQPLARIDNRVQNRVENRIRNRIDRDYDPRANATSPFEVAEDRQRRSGRPRRP